MKEITTVVNDSNRHDPIILSSFDLGGGNHLYNIQRSEARFLAHVFFKVTEWNGMR
jgi:hypothetical protein